MKTKLIALFCACFLLLNIVDMLIPRTEAKVYDNLIRLHILADDDSDEAQAIKLKVRDAILDECGDIFSSSDDIVKATEAVDENLEQIEKIANKVLKENGFDYSATAEWGKEIYPTRVYEDFTLPSGEYLSLRVKLGEAKGQNWWCVLFPPLCTGAASKDLTDSGISKSDSKVFTSRKYVFRFKLLELFGD